MKYWNSYHQLTDLTSALAWLLTKFNSLLKTQWHHEMSWQDSRIKGSYILNELAVLVAWFKCWPVAWAGSCCMFNSLWFLKAAHCEFLLFWLIAAHRALCSPVSVVWCIGSVYELDNYLVTLRLRQVNSGTSQLEYDMISAVTPRWLTNWILTDKSLFVSLTKALFCQLSIRTGTCDPEMFTDNKNKHNFCKHLASIMLDRSDFLLGISREIS